MRPTLIATDLDGTLLDDAGHIPPGNVAALARAHALGIPIVVSTGRPIRWLADLQPIAALEPHVVCSNGAVVYDLSRGEIESLEQMPVELSLQVARDLRAAEPSVAFGTEYGARWGREDAYPLRHSVTCDIIAPLPDLFADAPVVKLLASSAQLDTVRLAERLVPVVAGRLEATYSYSSAHGLLELSAPGVDKAAALRRLATALGVDLAGAVAFGNMPNDLAMLHEVGHPFVMANGDPGMLDGRFPIAPANIDAGVGQVLDRMLG